MNRYTVGVGVLVVLGGASMISVATATGAYAMSPTPVCGATSCTTTFAETGVVQTFTVPSVVTSVLVTASGGQGGDETAGGSVVGTGGRGGSSTAEVSVTGAEVLSIVVGGAGGDAAIANQSAGPAGFAGGGDGGTATADPGGGGGGGSFVFAGDEGLLVAAGGGGGASDGVSGGDGGSDNADATDGSAGQNNAAGGHAATAAANGLKGAALFADMNGQSGSGTVAGPMSLPSGGAGGGIPTDEPEGGGGGGGGGHFAGGGGGGDPSALNAGGGGGGAGFAIAAATNVTGTAGTHSGNGVVTIGYDKVEQEVMITSTAPVSRFVGQTYDVTTDTGGGSGNPVVLSVDDATTNDACSLSDSTVSFDHAGSCVIDADQAGDDDYQATPTAQQTVTVVHKPSLTAVSVTPSTIRVALTAAAPNVGTPTGSVTVTVDGSLAGMAELSGGVVTLNNAVPAGSTHHVAATYAGDNVFSGSSGTVQRRDPTVTVTVSSAKRETHGWYRRPVVVHFRCMATSAPLTNSCPGSVALSRSGKGQSVSRTIAATDGGAATATAKAINIDQVKPTVKITGPKAGKRYPGKVPKARCAGRDALSGVLTCTLSRHVSGHHVTVVATATDRAGNGASGRLTYTI
ncbi:MAG TPA: Ig-like domain-containing protein [Mycobacteriales bacterium]|nr:Ig-like domain-containing protein [Mycobacteriales bacterium]